MVSGVEAEWEKVAGSGTGGVGEEGRESLCLSFLRGRRMAGLTPAVG